ncbi:MAG: transporter substrate-binding domain-containing protein [Gammaproteobacteria bacterium]|nr:transporter substrate-binding domain-containing protein [Gammaproteobacteria bacterium]
MKILLSLALALGVSTAYAESKTVKLTSLEWPPYTGASMVEQGASVAVAKAAFEAMDYRLEVGFFPWSRAVFLAKQPGNEYAGYFPEYYAESLKTDFVFSEPMGTGPLGLVERKDAPVTWNSMDDLGKFKIGTVQDYINTAEFDQRAAEGKIKVEPVKDDVTNLRKLHAKRINAAVIDKHVLNFLLSNDASLTDAKEVLQFNAKTLEDKKLYICFRNDAKGQELAKIFNEGLKKIDVEAIMAKHLK